MGSYGDHEEKSVRSCAELAPWLTLVSDRVATTKDSSLLACFEFTGIDSDASTTSEINRLAELIDFASKAFVSHPITVWWTVKRVRSTFYPGGNFPDPVSRKIDDARRREFESGKNYINRHFLSVALRPEVGAARYLNRVQAFMENGENPVKSMVMGAQTMFSDQYAFAWDAVELDAAIDRFEETLTAFADPLRDLDLRRLEGDDMLTFFGACVSPTSAFQGKVHAQDGWYLDSYVPDAAMEWYGQDLLKFEGDPDGEGDQYVAALSIKGWPEATQPGMVDSLLTLDGELTISQIFRFAGKEETEKHLKAIRSHNDLLKHSWKGYLSAAFKKGSFASSKINPARGRASDEANYALGEVSVNKAFYGWYNFTVLCHGKTPQATGNLARDALGVMRYGGVRPIRERQHLESSFRGTLPGGWKDVARWAFLEVPNMSDLAPVRGVLKGSLHNAYMTEQTGRTCSALAVLSTDHRTPFYFNFHVKDLGHTFIVGPSRSGKSTFINLLLSQWRKYYPCRVIIFDKDFSCKIPTLLQGGDHIDLTSSGNQIRLNPLAMLGDEQHWEFLAQWLEILLTSRGYVLTSDDEKSVREAVEEVAHGSRSNWRLMSVYTSLPPHLKKHLETWVGDGALARYFDNEEDSFSISDMTCIEMGEVLGNTRVAKAFMDYAFYRIKCMLDENRTGTPVPTVIYIEECWFMLDDEAFEAKIRNWLKTLPKLLTNIVMCTQSMEDLAESKVFSAIRDNVPTRIFLPNLNATTESLAKLYRSQFELNDDQIHRIKTAITKRNYFITQPGIARMVECVLDAETLACLRSDSAAQGIFNRHYQSGREDWRETYLKEMTNAA